VNVKIYTTEVQVEKDKIMILVTTVIPTLISLSIVKARLAMAKAAFW